MEEHSVRWLGIAGGCWLKKRKKQKQGQKLLKLLDDKQKERPKKSTVDVLGRYTAQ